jgi:2-isopropylmalate synthase
MQDVIRESVQAGRMVIWEEIARDGGQAKTLMTGQERVAVAKAHAALHGKHGLNHVIFAAGFPAIAPEEVAAMRMLVHEVDECSLVAHVRISRDDINLGLQTMSGAKYGRVTFIVPVSEAMSRALLHDSQQGALRRSLDMARYALDRAAAHKLAVDVSLLDASRTEPELVAEVANLLHEEGIGVIKICDSVGEFYPLQSLNFIKTVKERVSKEVMLGIHNHNDLGFAHANNIVAVRAGIRVVSTSWLGLAERNGLGPTEQLLFALTYQPEKLPERLGVTEPLWFTPPDLRGLNPLAHTVSEYTGVPLKITDPIVGTSINTVSTGSAFVAPHLFQPFDAEEVLGVPPKVILTHLASARVITSVATELGYTLSEPQVNAAMRWVKSEAYKRGEAVLPKAEFASFLAGLTAIEPQIIIATPTPEQSAVKVTTLA